MIPFHGFTMYGNNKLWVILYFKVFFQKMVFNYSNPILLLVWWSLCYVFYIQSILFKILVQIAHSIKPWTGYCLFMPFVWKNLTMSRTTFVGAFQEFTHSTVSIKNKISSYSKNWFSFSCRIKIVFKWLIRGFSGYLQPEQLLYLWDLILAYDSLEIVSLLAVTILSFRKENLLQVNNLHNIEVK